MELIEQAFNHVKEFFPSLSMVVYNPYGQWCYMDDNFNAFDFSTEPIDIGLLEDASDSVKVLPFVYTDKK